MVIGLEPIFISPKLDVMDPLSNTPTDCNEELITVDPSVVSVSTVELSI